MSPANAPDARRPAIPPRLWAAAAVGAVAAVVVGGLVFLGLARLGF